MLTNLPVPYDLWLVGVVCAFIQEKAVVASRGLLRDCKTLHNLREPSFEALVLTAGLYGAGVCMLATCDHCLHLSWS